MTPSLPRVIASPAAGAGGPRIPPRERGAQRRLFREPPRPPVGGREIGNREIETIIRGRDPGDTRNAQEEPEHERTRESEDDRKREV